MGNCGSITIDIQYQMLNTLLFQFSINSHLHLHQGRGESRGWQRSWRLSNQFLQPTKLLNISIFTPYTIYALLTEWPGRRIHHWQAGVILIFQRKISPKSKPGRIRINFGQIHSSTEHRTIVTAIACPNCFHAPITGTSLAIMRS